MPLGTRLKIEEHGTPRHASRRRNLFRQAMLWRFSTGCGYPPLGAKPRTAWTLFGHQDAAAQRAEEFRMEHLRATLICLDSEACNDPPASCDPPNVGANS